MIAASTTALGKQTTLELTRADRYAQLELDMAMLRTLMDTGLTPRESLAVFRRELNTTLSDFRHELDHRSRAATP